MPMVTAEKANVAEDLSVEDQEASRRGNRESNLTYEPESGQS